jgi:predicted dehydrogenase
MPSEVRFGVIGCGEIAVQTCQGIATAPNASIGMLMDARPEVLQDLSEFYGVPTTTDVDELIANPDVDAVYIATPHYLHAPIGIKAAQAGKHVLVEKPITTTLEDADALIATCRQKRVKLGVAFLAQGDAAMNAARDLIRAGAIGRITAVRYTALGDKPETYWHGGYTQRVHTDWRTSKAQAGGGILIMNIVHDLNTVRYVTGLEVKRVYAEYDTLATPVEVEDVIGVVLRYTNGAVGVIQAGSTMRGRAHQDAPGPRIYGAKGQIILSERPLIYMTEPFEGRAPHTWGEIPFHGPVGDRQQMVSHFAHAILTDSEPPVSGLDGRKALEIIVAAYRSGEIKQPVEIG